MEYLTKHLVSLYEKSDKPTSTLEYLKNNYAGKEVEDGKVASTVSKLEKELEDARKNVTDRVAEKMDNDSAAKEDKR